MSVPHRHRNDSQLATRQREHALARTLATAHGRCCPGNVRVARSAGMRASGQPAKQNGFTLIEVLAALVIVALGMMAVIQAVSQTASNSTYLRDKTIAHWVALNQLTETRLQRTPPAIDESSDEVEMAGREWRWTMTVTQTPIESMRRIDISVRPADAPDGSSMTSITGFYGAAIAPPGSVLIDWDALAPEAGSPGGERDRDRQPGEEPPPGDAPLDSQDQEAQPPSDDAGGGE